MAKHVKNKTYIKEKQVNKDYSLGNASPYREWAATHNDETNDHLQFEPIEANPDSVSEEKALYYQAENTDDRLDDIATVLPTLTNIQKEILRMCGNEGRSMENCAAILGISKKAVRYALNSIRAKVFRAQKRRLTSL